MRCIFSVAILAALSACKPDKGGEKPKRAEPLKQAPEEDAGPGVPPDSAALFLAPDPEGSVGLFQLGSEGGSPTSVAGLEGSVFSAAAAQDGSAAAAIFEGESGPELVRILPGASPRSVLVDLELDPSQVRAVSSDGEVIVLQRPGRLAAVRRESARSDVVEIDVSKLGKLMYGVAISSDGARLAFSTMKEACAGTPADMASCPVRLYGVELGEDEPAPRAIEAPEGAVSYDPQFVGSDGSELIYMTSAGDDSKACREHVNRCRYDIRRTGFDGSGEAKTLVSGAVLARFAPDGTLSYRRREESSSGEPSWSTQRLVLVAPGGEATELPGEVRHWLHSFSPDSRRLLVPIRDGQVARLAILDREGERIGAGVAGREVRPVGWIARELPAGDRSVRAPRGLRALRRALAVAKEQVGGEDRVALFGLGGIAGELGGSLRAFEDVGELAAWAGERDQVAVIARETGFCTHRRQLERAGIKLDVVTRIPGEVAVAVAGAPDREREAAKRAGSSLATFDGSADGGGVIELAGFELPQGARAGRWFTATLRWRVKKPPPAGWKVFLHFDGQGERLQADYRPLCQGGWESGAVAVDRIEVEASRYRGAVSPGRYRAFVGWFRGSERAEVKKAGKARHPDDRLQLGSLEVRR